MCTEASDPAGDVLLLYHPHLAGGVLEGGGKEGGHLGQTRAQHEELQVK